MSDNYNVKIVSVNDCLPDNEHKFNIRSIPTDDKDETLISLVESIKANGVLDPIKIVVSKKNKGKYIIVDGNHRVKAAQLASLEKIPAIVIENEQDAKIIGLSINFQRKDLHCVEKARSLKELKNLMVQKDSKTTDKQVAQNVGLSEGVFNQYKKIAELPEKVLDDALQFKKFSIKKLYSLCPKEGKKIIKYKPEIVEKRNKAIIAKWEKMKIKINPEGEQIRKARTVINRSNEQQLTKCISDFYEKLGKLKTKFTSGKDDEAKAKNKAQNKVLIANIDTVIKSLSAKFPEIKK